MTEPRKLLTLEFIGLCIVTFLAFCNVAVFYNLFSYLQALGIPAELRGVVIGIYSLTAMVLYLVASPFITLRNSLRVMLFGMAVLVVSGMGYFFVHTFWALVALRIVNGAGQFCMSAGAMALFVSVIPPEKSGQAFGIYSIAILAAYGAVPAVMDSILPYIPTPPHGYAAATLTLFPAAWVVAHIYCRRSRQLGGPAPKGQLPAWGDIKSNVLQLPVALLLVLNMSYFANWGSLFFLFKGFALTQKIANVGVFFTVQMGVMVVLRLLAGHLFDAVQKIWLIGISFTTIAVGYLALDHLPGPWAVPLIGILFGLGMGVGYPAINGMMFEVSPPRFRSLNANLMLFAVQAGFFLGPVIGGALVARAGYHGYFMVSLVLSLGAAVISAVLARHTARRESGTETTASSARS